MWHKDAIRDMPRYEATIANIQTHTYEYNLNLFRSVKRREKKHAYTNIRWAFPIQPKMRVNFYSGTSGVFTWKTKSTAPMSAKHTWPMFTADKSSSSLIELLNWMKQNYNTTLDPKAKRAYIDGFSTICWYTFLCKHQANNIDRFRWKSKTFHLVRKSRLKIFQVNPSSI